MKQRISWNFIFSKPWNLYNLLIIQHTCVGAAFCTLHKYQTTPCTYKTRVKMVRPYVYNIPLCMHNLNHAQFPSCLKRQKKSPNHMLSLSAINLEIFLSVFFFFGFQFIDLTLVTFFCWINTFHTKKILSVKILTNQGEIFPLKYHWFWGHHGKHLETFSCVYRGQLLVMNIPHRQEDT
jgi:hypothetical protein